MKMNTKKLIAMGLAVVLTVGSLTGCGGDTPESSSGEGNANATAAPGGDDNQGGSAGKKT